MSRLNENLDFSFLLGEYLPQIAFGRYQVDLRFGRVTINILSPCEIRTADGKTLRWEPDREGDLNMFYRILESEVESYKVVDGHELVIRFANSSELSLIVDEAAFESFLFRFKSGNFMVI